MALAPVAFLSFLQFLPLPYWLTGFITGLVIGVPCTIYIMWVIFIKDDAEPSKFVDNLKKKVPKRPAIIVQEELEREFVRKLKKNFFSDESALFLCAVSSSNGQFFFIPLASITKLFCNVFSDLDESLAKQERAL